MKSHQICIVACCLLISLVSVARSAPQDDQGASELASKAANAQNSKEFEFAAEKWEQLIKEFPNSELVPRANFSAGQCYVELAEFKQAIDRLKAALPGLTDTKEQVPNALLLLGYAQLQQGDLEKAADPEAAAELWTTAAQTLGNMIKDHAQFAEAGQAAFFRATAFDINRLERLEEALEAYQQAVTLPSSGSEFKLKSMVAVADLYKTLGRPADALKWCETFRKEDPDGDHPLNFDVNYIDAVATIDLARADQTRGDRDSAKQRFRQAEVKLGQMLENLPAGEDPADLKFNRAFCLSQLEDFSAAAKLYADVADESSGTQADASLLYAGLNYKNAQQLEPAIELLKRATDQENQYRPTAAHLLAGIYLQRKEYQSAYDLAKRVLPVATSADDVVNLKMDLADAAYELPDKLEESRTQFQEVAEKSPDDRQAPFALYNVALISLNLKQTDRAISAAEEFVKLYPDSGYFPDTLAVAARAHLENKDYLRAAKAYEEIAFDDRFAKHVDQPDWQLGWTITRFLNGDYQQVVERMTPVVESLQGERRAEALHWIGASHMWQKQYQPAIATLTQALETSPDWRNADQTYSYLSQSYLRDGQRDAAEDAAKTLQEQFRNSGELSQVLFLLGNDDLEQKKYDQALGYFNQVIESFPESKQFAPALYGAASCLMKQKKFEVADQRFTQFIKAFPDHELVENASLQRASCRRLAGNTEASMAELKRVLETDLSESERVNALLELGKAQATAKAWKDAVATFTTLAQDAADDPRADQFYYELAWAHRENGQPESAIDAFSQIAERFPDSEFFGRAQFQVGTAAYDQQQWKEAVNAFSACLKSDSESHVRERAAYKLGWSHFKQEQYEPAYQAFTTQVQNFSEGDLLADGMFMVAECLFRQQEYGDAYQAYRNAKPVVAESKVADPKLNWLVMLHGAQAANKSKQYQAAIDLAQDIEATEADASLKQDVYLELGSAYSGLKNDQQAMEYWKRATASSGKTGARAYCMIGDQYFREKKFDQATDQFKEVFFGFQGTRAPDDVKPWQAYALYETARCYYVQVKDAPEDQKARLVDQALNYFTRLLKDYPNDRLAEEAKRQQAELVKIREQLSGQ